MKRKLLCIITAVCVTCSMFTAAACASSDGVKVYLDNSQVKFDVQPRIENSRTLVPMRAIFEAMGAKVEWIEETRHVVVSTSDGNGIDLGIDKTEASTYKIAADGSKTDVETHTLDVPAKIDSGRTLVPLRFISESLKYKVDWDGDRRNVYIGNCDAVKASFVPAKYTKDRKDHSFKSDGKCVNMDRWFDMIVFSEGQPGADKMNAEMQKEYDRIKTKDEWKDNDKDDPKFAAEDTFTNTYTASVTQNADGYVSVKYDSEWYQGGVHNADTYGVTFDLAAQKRVTLAEAIPMEKAELDKAVKAAIRAYMDKNKGEIIWMDDASKTVDEMTSDTIDYYIEKGEVFVCVHTYELAAGAYGHFNIPTGLSI